jgi:phospholipase C
VVTLHLNLNQSLTSLGCDKPGLNCYPLTWKTTAEYYEDANVTWQVWQNVDNWEDNPFSWFEQFINAPNGSAYQIRGNSNTGLDAFFRAAHEGTLPQVSFIVADQELTEVRISIHSLCLDAAMFMSQSVNLD